MANGCHIENGLLAISQRVIMGLTRDYRINAKFCRIKQNHVLTQDAWPKYQISKIQDGGRPPFENGFIAITQPGIIRFQRNLVCRRKLRFQGRSHDKVPQFCKFNMADGRQNENRIFGYIWKIYCLINATFRTKEHNYTQTQITW